MFDDSFKVIGLKNSHATNELRSSCATRDLRDIVASILWFDGAAPPSKEGLLWDNVNYDQKRRSTLVSNN